MGGWAARKALKVVEHVEQGDAVAPRLTDETFVFRASP